MAPVGPESFRDTLQSLEKEYERQWQLVSSLQRENGELQERLRCLQTPTTAEPESEGKSDAPQAIVPLLEFTDEEGSEKQPPPRPPEGQKPAFWKVGGVDNHSSFCASVAPAPLLDVLSECTPPCPDKPHSPRAGAAAPQGKRMVLQPPTGERRDSSVPANPRRLVIDTSRPLDTCQTEVSTPRIEISSPRTPMSPHSDWLSEAKASLEAGDSDQDDLIQRTVSQMYGKVQSRMSAATYGNSEVEHAESEGLPSLSKVWTSVPVRCMRTKSRPNGLPKAGDILDASKLLFLEKSTGTPIMRDSSCLDRFLMKPSSPQRLLWDVLSIIMVVYDVITVPLLFFDFEETQLTKTVDWFCSVFWVNDLLMTCLTGIHREGVLEMRPKEIAKRYLRGWFAFDFMIIGLDWTLIAARHFSDNFQGVGGLARTLRGSRLMRGLRTIRLIRFIRLSRILHEFFEFLCNEYMRLIAGVMLAFSLILMCNHYIACGWWAVGRSAMYSGKPNWIQANDIYSKSNSYRYFTSLHWSLTQFTAASMEVRPYNLEERIYSICVLFFAMVAFSSFLGTITSTMTQMRKLHTDGAKQELTLRQYLSENKVSTDLGQRIWKHFKHNHFRHMRTTRGEIELLKMLPDALRKSLREELYRPYIIRMPFFFHYMVIDIGGMRDMCDTIVTDNWYQTGDEAFTEGKRAEKVYFIATGVLKYSQHTDANEPLPTQKLREGSWASEPALWVDWSHCGTLTSHSTAEVLQVSVRGFHNAMEIHSKINAFAFAKTYAYSFRALMEDSGHWYTDIWADTRYLHQIAYDVFEMLHGSDTSCIDVLFGKPAGGRRPSFTALQNKIPGRLSGRSWGEEDNFRGELRRACAMLAARFCCTRQLWCCRKTEAKRDSTGSD